MRRSGKIEGRKGAERGEDGGERERRWKRKSRKKFGSRSLINGMIE